MCGRFKKEKTEAELIERFRVEELLFDAAVRYNIAPTQQVAIVRFDNGMRILDGARWGLIPPWAKDAKIGNKAINARAESLADKPMYRNALARRRCIVAADGFYEWKKTVTGRVPMHIALKGGGLFGFAGLWEEWRDPHGETVHSCTIITTTPNELTRDIHDRMPAILRPEDEDDWLTAPPGDVSYLLQLLKPYPAEEMEAHAVGNAVNSVASEGPGLVVPVDETMGQGSLF